MLRQMGVHVSFCRSTNMDKWTYRQLYRCVVGGNARAREHWKRQGVDPHQKIESKYGSSTAQSYKTILEKDVAEACRKGGDDSDHDAQHKKQMEPAVQHFASSGIVYRLTRHFSGRFRGALRRLEYAPPARRRGRP